MDSIGWNTLLFASKWILLGLIYLALFTIVIAVRRELSYRVESRQPAKKITAGHLKVLDPGSDKHLQAGTSIDLYPDTSLGAAEDNDIVLGDAFVSAQHARLRWDGSRWWLEDLGSRNGTFIDQERCSPHTPRVLPSRSHLQIGDMTFELMA